MSAIIELHRVLLDRRNMQVLQTIMQSERAGIVEKQEAELAIMRENLHWWSGRSTLFEVQFVAAESRRVEAELNAATLAIEKHELERRVFELEDKLRRARKTKHRVVDNYSSIIDDCMAVKFETVGTARGQKRSMTAKEQLAIIKDILQEHTHKRSRLDGNVVRAAVEAGSSTD